jgi:hypothetical protein
MTEAEMQSAFLEALPRIEAHGRYSFRGTRGRTVREECLAEMVALAWEWWKELCLRELNPSPYVSAIASFAVQAVRGGRRLCGQEQASDVLSRPGRQRHGFAVVEVPGPDTNQPAPDEQSAFPIGISAWLESLSHHERCDAAG